MTRLAFIGAGSMGQSAHLRNYAHLPDCEVVALCETNEPFGRAVARRYEIPAFYTDFTRMIETEKPDGVVAILPYRLHHVLLPRLFEHRIPVFIEKPIADTVAHGELVLDALEKSGSWLMVGYHKRNDPATRYVKSLIDELRSSGEFGAMTYVRILLSQGDWTVNGFDVRISPDDVPGATAGAAAKPTPEDPDFDKFINVYVHQINMFHHLLGEPYHIGYADPTGRVFVGQSDAGVPCTFEMKPYRVTGDYHEEVLICFEKGYVKLRIPAPLAYNRAGSVEVYRDPGDGVTPERAIPQMPWEHAFHRQARNFVAAVAGAEEPMCQAREALEDLKVAEEYFRVFRATKNEPSAQKQKEKHS